MIVRLREDPTALALMVSGVVLIVASVGFLFLAPKPTTAGLRTQHRREESKIIQAVDQAQLTHQQSSAFIATHTWQGSEDDISPTVLSRVTQLARARNLRFVTMRPQRIDTKIQPPQLPFLVTVEGPYPNVILFARDLENPGTRLAVSLVSITSADAASDKVTGSIGLVAYLAPKPAAPRTTTTNTSPASKENARA